MNVFFFLSQSRKLTVELFQNLQFICRKIFGTYESIAGRFTACYQLIQFYLQGNRVLVLCLLNDKYHQKSNDGGTCINNELPGIRIMENGTGYSPNNNKNTSYNECCWFT